MIKKNLNVLLLEDEPLDAELITEQLSLLEKYSCKIIWVKDRKAFEEALDTKNPDIVLSDYNLLGFTGLEALRIILAKKVLVPFIFVTGALDEETAVSTIKAGAWDYVVKDRLIRLPLAIEGALRLREQKEIILLAEQQSRKLLLTIEQSPVNIIVMNVNYQIEYVNKKFTENTGFFLDDLSGADSWRLVLDSLPEKYFQELHDGPGAPANWTGEMQSKKKDGKVYWESVSISPLINEENRITHYIIFKEDITQRKHMVQELIKARNKAERSDKLKDAFLQNLSHEIRTPLNAIVGFSSLLEGEEDMPSYLKEYTSIILSSSNQLLAIVDDILTISRIQTGQEHITSTDIMVNTLIDDLYSIFKTQASVNKIQFAFSKQEPDHKILITSDEGKLSQILTNLLNNAFKYTNEGSIEYGYSFDENEIRFFVKDTGIGITADDQKIIFDRFRQADSSFARTYGGTGLGLSISKSFAELLGGKIWVESELKKGSVFYLSIPCRVKRQDKSPVDMVSGLPDREILILVAEDEKYNYMLIETYLKEMNIKVIHAHNGQEAMDLCNQNLSIDLVLMDIKMPQVDGVTAMHEIKKINGNLPVIAQTAYALESEKQHLLNFGFDDYISKPIRKDELMVKIIRWIVV